MSCMAETTVKTHPCCPLAPSAVSPSETGSPFPPMCQYCAENGMADDWHLVHLGSRAAGGAGLVVTEATAVTAQGRITPGDLGLWSDEQIEPLARIARFLSRLGAVPGIQLAHAGRKASTTPPWARGKSLEGSGAWETVSASAIPFAEEDHVPRALMICRDRRRCGGIRRRGAAGAPGGVQGAWNCTPPTATCSTSSSRR